MSDAKDVIVTVSDEALDEIEDVVSQLRDHGFTVAEVLEVTGHVTGSWSGELDELKTVPGVLDAEYSERSYPQDEAGDS